MTRTTRIALATLATVVALPTAAHAATPSTSSVVAHVKKSQGAQARVATLSRRGDDGGARRVLKVARREAVTAARQARALAAAAPTTTNAAAGEQSVFALTAATANYEDAIKQFLALIPDASQIVQQALAAALPGTLAGRDQLIGDITALTAQLQGIAQDCAQQALDLFAKSAPSIQDDLSKLSTMNDLPAVVSDLVAKAVDLVKQALAAIVPTTTDGTTGNTSDNPLGGLLDFFPGLSSLFGGLIPTS